MRRFRNNNRSLTGWNLCLQEYSLEINHTNGKDNVETVQTRFKMYCYTDTCHIVSNIHFLDCYGVWSNYLRIFRFAYIYISYKLKDYVTLTLCWDSCCLLGCKIMFKAVVWGLCVKLVKVLRTEVLRKVNLFFLIKRKKLL